MSTDTTRNGRTMLKADRMAVNQLLAAAELDTDPVSVFMDGASPEHVERAILVIKGRDHIAYLTQLLLRQGLMTEGKKVEGGGA
jgi:hypothetical protein